MSTSQEPEDRCPAWAVTLIRRLCDLEVQLGHVNPGNEWHVSQLRDLVQRQSHDDDESLNDDATESLFRRVSRGLADEGYDVSEIAGFINRRIPTGKVPYCSASEVDDALNED